MRHCNTLPLSSNQQTMKKFSRSVNTLLEKGNYVLVYPEQSMWYNYRKPRPLKDGAFHMATKANVPVLPCFITMEDSEQMDNEGYPIQEYTIHIMKPIYPNPELSNRENINKMKDQNAQDWKECYENFYHKKLD